MPDDGGKGVFPPKDACHQELGVHMAFCKSQPKVAEAS